MRITNKHNLPEAVYNFLARDRYVAGNNDISVTTLIGPPLKAKLIKEHGEELETDAMDLVWSLLGNGVHQLLDDHTVSGIAEERLYARRNGITIGGQIDNRHGDCLSDYKVTSVYKVMAESYDEWECQLNCYAWLCREDGIEINELKIVTFLRDWRESALTGYQSTPNYPTTPCVVINIPLWDWEQQEEYIHSRLRAHAECIPCTDKEMWAEPDKWAFKKVGGKRAIKVYDDEHEAKDRWLGLSFDDQQLYELEYRPGRRRHCERYCPARDVCPQWKEFNGNV